MSDEVVVAAPVVPDAPSISNDHNVTIAVVGNANDSLGNKRSRYTQRDELLDIPTADGFKPVATAAPVETNTAVSTSTAAPVISTSTATATSDPIGVVEPKLYAGKFKTVEELEISYKEAEKMAHTKAQEAAELKKKAEVAPVISPIVDAEKEKERKAALLNKILDDPESVTRDIAAQVEKIAADRKALDDMSNKWRDDNKDIAQYEKFVGYEMQHLMATNPELTDTAALLAQATTNFRQEHGKIREAGKHEALQVRSSVTPLADSKIQVPPPTEQPKQAPKTEDQVRSEHFEMLKTNAARVRRVVR